MFGYLLSCHRRVPTHPYWRSSHRSDLDMPILLPADVVVGQYSSTLDAITPKKSDFLFDEETILLTMTIGVTDKAHMELKTDKQLASIDTARMELQLEYEPIKIVGVYILKPCAPPQIHRSQCSWPAQSRREIAAASAFSHYRSTSISISSLTLRRADLVIEALDNNEVALQNMMVNRFIGFFESPIQQWKPKLGQVRSVLEDWVKVLDDWMEMQRQWCSPDGEAIFVGSEDIQKQLPEDAECCDIIDGSLKEQVMPPPFPIPTPPHLSSPLLPGRAPLLSLCPALSSAPSLVHPLLNGPELPARRHGQSGSPPPHSGSPPPRRS